MPEGGSDVAGEGAGTPVAIYNVPDGPALGKLLAPLALCSARKGAGDFGQSIKRAVDAS